jgi:maltooligosyltrehalose trehalohydrolase
LFQGQEFGSRSPFQYFSHQSGNLADSLREGRIQELQQFPSSRDPNFAKTLPGPSERDTFESCKLDWSEFGRNAKIVALHRDLIALRRTETVFANTAARRAIDGSVLGSGALLLRFFGVDPQDDRLLFINYGDDIKLRSIPDPLTAPPRGTSWTLQWSSEWLQYGGSGQRPVDLTLRWTLSSNTALLMRPGPVQRGEQSVSGGMSGWQKFVTRSE